MKAKAPIVIIGIGELGGEFARGFLRCGHPVYPITRQQDLTVEQNRIPSPLLVLITVRENQLDALLKRLPEPWRDKVGLVQNELLPRHWQRHHIADPSIAVVWFEKKPGMALHNILYTPVYGPHAKLLAQALTAIAIPHKTLASKDELLYELVRKSLYILTVNICGIAVGGSVGNLWQQHQPLAREVALEAIAILEWLVRKKLPAERLIAGVVEGIEDCPGRNCLGRSAPSRLERTLQNAEEAGISTPRMREIFSKSRNQ